MGLLKKIFKKKKTDAAATVPKAAPPAAASGPESRSAKPPVGAAPSSAAPAPKKETIMGSYSSAAPAASNAASAAADLLDSTDEGSSSGNGQHHRFASYASGASTPDWHSDDNDSHHSHHSSASAPTDGNAQNHNRRASNPKMLSKSSSAIGLDEMIEDRRADGDLRQNVVHIEVPFGKPIEEVYEGVHTGPVLGSGISGLVRLVTHKATGLKYAVKVLDLGLVDTSEGLRQLREEIFIMCQLDHPNIVRLEEVYESQSEIYLVQELCLGGELFDRLDEQPDYHYTEAECARLVKQMLSAVRYLHSRGIIHRDLKLENFLFSSTSKDSELRMIDFGLSKHFRYGEVQHEAVGTPYTVAPEVIRGSYDERCDIWAIGVISFLLLSGDPPFGGCGGPEPLMTVRANILRGAFYFEPEEIWANVSRLARDFISDMLKTDPKDRPTARMAQQHKWLQEWASRSRKGKDNVINPNVVKALVNFKEFSDMRKLLCEVLSFTLLPYQIKELRREFEKMDTDGSGEISLSALKQVLISNAGAGSLGALTEEEVEDIFNAMRVRKTETRIHWHEFIAAGLSQCQVDDRNLRLAFDRLDSDHKGYIILDDIMDLMGSDALQSEDDMHQMWGDSIKAIKSKHAHITFDDFLLLMKGQTKEGTPSQDLERGLESSVSSFMGSALQVVPETVSTVASPQSPQRDEAAKTITLPSGDVVTVDGKIQPAAEQDDSKLSPGNFSSSPPALLSSQSAPTTPAQHKKIIDLAEESPLSMDDDMDITSSGPGVPGCAQSLTPPMSPCRGFEDYVTPGHQNRTMIDFKELRDGLMLPGLPQVAGVSKPPPYTRRRSRSMDDQAETQETQELHAVADVVRDMMLPETVHLGAVERDSNKSALVVNRKLYRAHRQMRLAVVEASKRFEEQQAEHAREVILAARGADDDDKEAGHGMIQAGLVMRHGHKKQVSSQAIRTLLEENRALQQKLVEKASRRGGRGRRSRKKTISDMSGMLNSMGQDDLNTVAQTAALEERCESERVVPNGGSMYEDMAPPPVPPVVDVTETPIDPEDLSAEGPLRAATVPGEFRKTSDPFGSHGRYGAVASWK